MNFRGRKERGSKFEDKREAVPLVRQVRTRQARTGDDPWMSPEFSVDDVAAGHSRVRVLTGGSPFCPMDDQPGMYAVGSFLSINVLILAFASTLICPPPPFFFLFELKFIP